MPQFKYTAKEPSGQIVSGVRQAASAGAIAQELRAGGLLPIRINTEGEGGGGGEESQVLRLFERGVSLNELIVFSHQMSSLTRAGISVVRAVKTLAESAKNQSFRDVLADVATNMEAGVDVASSMGRHPRIFTELYVSLIHVGENTGRLDQAFKQIASYLELERETRRRIQAATRYPSFVIVAIAIAVVIVNIYVIPAFAGVFEKYNAELPWQTKAILTVSDTFVAYWPFMLAALVVAGFGWLRFVSSPEGRLVWHRWKLKLPILGSVFDRIYLARYCNTFAMVSRAGVPIVQGLQIVSRAIGNDYMATRINEMRANIERGESITTTARQAAMFSPVVLQMMSVGEETGNMEELLEQAAEFYEEEVEYELKGLTDALEPILIIAIAGLVLIMALGVFLPLWDLNSVAQH